MASSEAADLSRRSGARRRTVLSFATFGWRGIVREVQQSAASRIVAIEQAPTRPVALILGARVRDMKPTAVLEDRVRTGAELHARGKVEKLLLSGTPEEVAVMSTLLAELDVPGTAQLLDPRGHHTFESIRNAQVLGHRELLIVSQAFHLPRSLFLAARIGLDAHGIAADRRTYTHQRKFEQREIFSSVLAYWMTR